MDLNAAVKINRTLLVQYIQMIANKESDESIVTPAMASQVIVYVYALKRKTIVDEVKLPHWRPLTLCSHSL
jgi:hypothetical protein